MKPDKNPACHSSYRPIALSSVLCKIFEHLLKNRLDWELESNNILPKFQFGFRKGRSTIDSLSILTTDIRLAFSKNEHLCAAV
ncbi:reverse transcriptase domain-containing protein, partial [Vibrio cholerae]|uniref:reverse transcriptase domain-containing protein n=1 Tax=Vibrio cholerae TaxID=666 RepID=UPI003B217033